MKPKSSPAMVRLDNGATVSTILGLGVLVCVLVALPPSILWSERFIQPKELILLLCAAGTSLIALIGTPGDRLRLDRTDLALVIFLGLGLLSSAAVAHNPWLATRSMGSTVASLLIFWSARSVADPTQSRWLLGWMVAALGCAALLAVLEAYGVVGELSPPGRAPGGTLGNRNRLAHLLVVGCPVLLACAAQVRTRISMYLLVGCVGVSSAALILSRSRGAWLGMLALSVFAVVTWIVGGWGSTIPQRRAAALLGAALLGGSAAVLLPNRLEWNSDSPYSDTVARLADYRTGSGFGRVVQYATTLRMIRDRPILGVGPGNWAVQYPAYASPGDPSYQPFALSPTNDYPHGDWIGIASERGLAALVMLGCAACALLLGVWRRATGLHSHERVYALALTAGVIATVVVGLFDSVLYTPAALFWASLSTGIFAAKRGDAYSIPLSLGVRLTGIIVVVLLIGAPVYHAVNRIRAGYAYTSHRNHLGLEDAVALDPGAYETRILLATTWMRRGRCDLALPHIESAARLLPHTPGPSRLRARCLGSPNRADAPVRGLDTVIHKGDQQR